MLRSIARSTYVTRWSSTWPSFDGEPRMQSVMQQSMNHIRDLEVSAVPIQVNHLAIDVAAACLSSGAGFDNRLQFER